MIKLLITKFWPAFIPILLYLLWLYVRRRKAKKQGEEVPGWRDGPWAYAVIASLLLLIGGFIYLALSADSNRETGYTPKRYEGGKLIPESLE